MMPSPLTACLTFLKTQIKAFRPFLVYSFTQTQGQGGGGGGGGGMGTLQIPSRHVLTFT